MVLMKKKKNNIAESRWRDGKKEEVCLPGSLG